ncbi:MAG: DMT family transporter [Thermodesulfobacteriota bacterium]
MTQKNNTQILNRNKGIVIVSLGVFVLSLDALLVRMSATSNWNILFWRGIFMFLTLGIISFSRKRNYRPVNIKILTAGAMSAFFFGVGGSCFVSSIMFTNVANSVVIISSAPLFAAIFTRLFRIDKISSRTWIAILCALTGVALVFSGSLGSGGLTGDLIAVATACLLGANLTLLRKFPTLDRMLLIGMGGLIMCLLSAPLAAPFSLEPRTYLILAIMGLLQMPLALVLIAQSTKYLPSPEVSLFLLIETILGPVWVWLVIGEKVPVLTFLGGSIILSSIIWHSWLGIREMRKFYNNSWRKR